MRNKLSKLFIIFTAVSVQALAITPNNQSNWYDNFIFHDPNFTFEFIRTLGYSYEKGADLGESIATARKITDGDFNSWYESWLNTAKRIESLAITADQQKQMVTARETHLRASNYYRTAGFYMVDVKDQDKSISAYDKSKENFLKAISYLPYVEVVTIPYEKTKLTGYLIHAKNKNAPLVIVNTGFDGTAEELYFEVGEAFHARGYNCLLVDGPGQGNVLRKQNLPFRPDWEKVVTPIVDYVETLKDIDKNKIALMGISMGGYLAPRAAAFEPRIKALIANGGVYDLGAAAYAVLPKELIDLIDNNPDEFNKYIENEMKSNTTARWYYKNGMWSFHAKTPADFMKKIRLYNLNGVTQNIKATTLIVDSEADTFMKGQARTLFEKLKSPKTYILFTRQQAAQSHCQMGATAISNEFIIDWLDNVFGMKSD